MGRHANAQCCGRAFRYLAAGELAKGWPKALVGLAGSLPAACLVCRTGLMAQSLSACGGQSATKANEPDLRTNRAGVVDGVCPRVWHARFTCGRFIATGSVQLERLGDRNLNRRRTGVGARWGRGF